jgi:hypothetical protein
MLDFEEARGIGGAISLIRYLLVAQTCILAFLVSDIRKWKEDQLKTGERNILYLPESPVTGAN